MQPRPGLQWLVFASSLAVLFPAFAVMGLLTWRHVSDTRAASDTSALRVQARLIASQLQGSVKLESASELRAKCDSLETISNVGIIILLPNGEELGERVSNPNPGIRYPDAEQLKIAVQTQSSEPAAQHVIPHAETLLVTAPLGEFPNIQGTLLLIQSNSIRTFGSALPWILWFSLIAIPISGILSRILTRRLVRSLNRLRDRAGSVVQVQMKEEVTPVDDFAEFTSVMDALNRVVRQLNRRIDDLAGQRNELDAVLSSMVEGIMAVDAKERVLNLNTACVNLFGLHELEVIGRSVQEVIRNTEFQRFVAKALASEQVIEEDILVIDDSEKFVQARGTALRDANQARIGCVIALNDVTRLRTLERAQREFVANVSHELKTPLTSIKGYAATLLDDGLDSREEAQRFLGIIVRQADTLNVLIEDLLALSRLEQDSLGKELAKEQFGLHEALTSAIHQYREAGNNKGMRFTVEVIENPRIFGNPVLVERAIGNLIDNAVKYSNEGGEVLLRLTQEEGWGIVTVQDFGTGIERDHLPHLFERFYRVDKARSRKMGGTGLGLSIVRHIMRVHDGNVSVESTPGRGSTFLLRFPVR